MNKNVTQEQLNAIACYNACLAAGIDPAKLAADPEAVKRLVEAADDALEALLMVRSGKSVNLNSEPDGIVDTLQTALRAIGKGGE